MDFFEVLERRFSCRRFLDTAVPAEDLKEIVHHARRVPSWGNTQPWRAYAAGGEIACGIREGLLLAFSQGEPAAPDFPMPAGFDPPLAGRYRALGRSLFAWLGMDRKDREKRRAHFADNLNAFGAPVLVYFTVPAEQGLYTVFDAGAFVTAFCLAAAERGLGTCVMAALARYPQVVRRHLDIPSTEKILVGAALGHADPAAKANSFRADREPVENILTLKGFG